MSHFLEVEMQATDERVDDGVVRIALDDKLVGHIRLQHVEFRDGKHALDVGEHRHADLLPPLLKVAVTIIALALRHMGQDVVAQLLDMTKPNRHKLRFGHGLARERQLVLRLARRRLPATALTRHAFINADRLVIRPQLVRGETRYRERLATVANALK